jgi:glycosyltransferase involved in cell wall biosynthesis
LNDSKGGETLIRALAEIPNAKLLMLGGQTGASDDTNLAYLARVKAVIDELHLASRVVWTDFMPQSEISAHFLASDICVLPYRDGASYRRGTFMAALAHAMAIVTTEPSGTTDLPHVQSSQTGEIPGLHSSQSSLPSLRNGENVMLVPPDDPGALADAVKRIAASPELRAKLQEGARATAQFFTWDKIADAHLALYHNLLRGQDKPPAEQTH